MQTDQLSFSQAAWPSDYQQKREPAKYELYRSSWPHDETERKRKKSYVHRPYRKLEKLWNTKVTAIPNVIDVLGTVTKGLVQGLEDFGNN